MQTFFKTFLTIAALAAGMALCATLPARALVEIDVNKGVIEPLLRDAGYVLTHVPDAHLCCGSAGTYSLLHPALSQPLLRNKVMALESDGPAVVATRGRPAAAGWTPSPRSAASPSGPKTPPRSKVEETKKL